MARGQRMTETGQGSVCFFKGNSGDKALANCGDEI